MLPSSPFNQAVHYVLERREALRVFLEDPSVPMDTNHFEREIRPIAFGRKYRRFRRKKTRAGQYLQRIAQQRPGLFAHWRSGMTGVFA